MRLDNYPEGKLKKELSIVCKKYLDTSKYKLFLFGSRVTGFGSDRSDIDLGIDGPEKIPFGIMGKIKEEIGNIPVLYKIDVVDFKNTSTNFTKVALSKIEPIQDDKN